MAIRTGNDKTEFDVICKGGEYNGSPTFSVGRENIPIHKRFNGGAKKWESLLDVDADGDLVMMTLVEWLEKHGTDFGHTLDRLDSFVEHYVAWKESYLDAVAQADKEAEGEDTTDRDEMTAIKEQLAALTALLAAKK